MARVKWSVAQAAKNWGVTHATVLRWIRSGRLPPESWEKVRETRGVVYFIREGKRPEFGDTAFAPIPFIPRKVEEVVEEAAPAEEPEAEEADEEFDYGDSDGQYEVDEGPSPEELEEIEKAEKKKPRRIVVR